MTPEQAADAAATLRAARVIPSDYGAHSRSPFIGGYAGTRSTSFRAAMTKRGLADRVLVLETGESWHLAKPRRSEPLSVAASVRPRAARAGTPRRSARASPGPTPDTASSPASSVGRAAAMRASTASLKTM